MNKGLVIVALFVAGIPQALAGTTNSVGFLAFQVPTLDEVGLVGLTMIVAIAGGIAARRRKKK
jgi:hypothetical protein